MNLFPRPCRLRYIAAPMYIVLLFNSCFTISLIRCAHNLLIMTQQCSAASALTKIYDLNSQHCYTLAKLRARAAMPRQFLVIVGVQAESAIANVLRGTASTCRLGHAPRPEAQQRRAGPRLPVLRSLHSSPCFQERTVWKCGHVLLVQFHGQLHMSSAKRVYFELP